jgi:stage V sporulation protein G
MMITNVQILRTGDMRNVRGVASITIDNIITIKDIRIVEGSNGLFIRMPSNKLAAGQFRHLVEIKSEQLKMKISESILGQYAEEMSRLAAYS